MKRLLLTLGLLAALGAGLALALQPARAPHRPPAARTAAAPAPRIRAHPRRVPAPAPWPTYGRDAQRTGSAAFAAIRPPYRVAWILAAGSLVEFPPVLDGGRLYFGTNGGRVLAVAAASGHPVWARSFGRCIAASPALGDGAVYVPTMDPSPCARHRDAAGGFMLALSKATGRELWRFRAGVIESSPLLVGGTLYFGSWDRRVYALDAHTGRVRWSFTTGDKVKGGAAYAAGTVFIGSYDGRLYALAAATGRPRWTASVGSSIYATPSVAAGKVFVGGLGGSVSAFRTTDGRLLWTTRTGSYIYSSVAVWQGAAYVGSYDGRVYALDAGTGRIRWSFAAGGPVSGTPTVIAGVVYAARCSACIAGQTRLGPRGTFALDASTGRLLWTFPDGEYTPLVADHRRAYLVGYSRIFGLVPRLRSDKSAEMTYHTTPRGAKVFAAGVINFGGTALWPVSPTLDNLWKELSRP